MDVEQQPDTPTDEAQLSMPMAISREMVRLYKEQFGRGPSRVFTHWAGPDTVVCILEQTLTPAERNLVKMGEHQTLRNTRMVFQYATVAEFCEPVERITGRKVKMFFSGVDTEADGAAIETFVLHPHGSEEPSRANPPSQRREDLQEGL